MTDFTQANKDAIDAHLTTAGVVQSTEFADQKTVFRPLDEILKLRALVSTSIANGATSTPSRSRFAGFRKGI